MRRNRRRMTGRNMSGYRGMPQQKKGPAQTSGFGRAYFPDVRPFMRQYGYQEGLEDILHEIEGLPERNNFYYERGDLWRQKQ